MGKASMSLVLGKIFLRRLFFSWTDVFVASCSPSFYRCSFTNTFKRSPRRRRPKASRTGSTLQKSLEQAENMAAKAAMAQGAPNYFTAEAMGFILAALFFNTLTAPVVKMTQNAEGGYDYNKW